MTPEQLAVMELALEALEESLGYVEEEAENAQRLYGQYPTRQARIQGLKDDARKHMNAITAIREALAEQPAQPSQSRSDVKPLTDEQIIRGGEAVSEALRAINIRVCDEDMDATEKEQSIAEYVFTAMQEAAHGIKGDA